MPRSRNGPAGIRMGRASPARLVGPASPAPEMQPPVALNVLNQRGLSSLMAGAWGAEGVTGLREMLDRLHSLPAVLSGEARVAPVGAPYYGFTPASPFFGFFH